MSKTGLKFYPATHKKNVISKRTPIYMRITKDGKKAEARTQCDLTEDELSLWNNKLGRVNLKNCLVNDYLNTIEEAYMHFKILNATTMSKYSATEIRNILLNKNRDNRTTIFDYALKYYENNIVKGTKYAVGTQKNYLKAIRHLEKFVEVKRLTGNYVSELDYEFARKFTNYLMTETNNHKGMSEVSACGIIKKCRKIYNEAVEEELITKNPFLRIKLSYKSPQKPKLSLTHMQSINSNNFLRKDEKKTANIFLFMSFTGCAYQDCMDLTEENLEISKDGIKLRYSRNKTGHESIQFLTQSAIKLLNLFQEYPEVSSGAHIVPRISNQHLNRMLRLIGTKAGIPFNVTSHSSRHFFRSILDEADIVDPSVIRKLMGWSNSDSMDSIYRKVTDSRLIKTKDQLEKLLNQIL